MAERVFFLADPSFRSQSQMIEDLLAIARVSDEAIEAMAATLEDADGFLDEKRLQQLVEETIHDESAASAVANAVASLRPGRVKQALSTLDDWRQADPKNAERFPDGARAAVQEKLVRLIRSYPALERYRKARRLQSMSGNQAQDIEILCDARPIFDEPRERIEGIVTLTTLRIVYETQAEETRCFEVALSPDLFEELLASAEKAQQKLKVLRGSITRWIPEGLADRQEMRQEQMKS